MFLSPIRFIRNVLDLVYSDVCGPMIVRTLGGCLYFISFMDDYIEEKCGLIL